MAEAKKKSVAWKSPSDLAEELEEGEVRQGLDGFSQWRVVCLKTTGAHRWYRIHPKPFTTKSGHPTVTVEEQGLEGGRNVEEMLQFSAPIVLGKRGGGGRGRGRARGRGRGNTRALPPPPPPLPSPSSAAASAASAKMFTEPLYQPASWTELVPTMMNQKPTAVPITLAKTRRLNASAKAGGEAMEIEIVEHHNHNKTKGGGGGGGGATPNSAFQWTSYDDPTNIFMHAPSRQAPLVNTPTLAVTTNSCSTAMSD